MKTLDKVLLFNKRDIIELKDAEINTIQGASTYVCSNCMSVKTLKIN